MDVRIVYRDILVPAARLKRAIPNGKKFMVPESRKIEILLAAFHDHFTLKRNSTPIDASAKGVRVPKLSQLLKGTSYSKAEVEYIEKSLPQQIEELLKQHSMLAVTINDYLCQAFWREEAFELYWSRDCLVFRFPRVYHDHTSISVDSYINRAIKTAMFRMRRQKKELDSVRTVTWGQPYRKLLRPNLVEYIVELMTGNKG